MSNHWDITKIGDIIDLYDYKRVPLSAKQRKERQGQYPYFGASGVIDHIDDWIFDGQFLLIAEDGENLNSRKLPIAFFAKGKFWVNNHAHIIKGKSGVADDYFIKAWFDQANISGYITGAAQPKLSQENLKRIEVRLPPYEVQKGIASILSAYDDLIENNTRRIQILEEMAQRIYTEWFVNFRFPGHEKVKFVDSELGKIPSEWGVGTIADVSESVEYGYTAKAASEPIGPKLLRITDIVPPMINWENVPYCTIPRKKVSKYELTEGDIVVARTGATTGYAKRLNRRHPNAVYASYLVRIRANKEVSDLYLGTLVESDAYKTYIKSIVGGAAQPNANAKMLTSMLITIPPRELTNDYEKCVQPLVDQKEGPERVNENETPLSIN